MAARRLVLVLLALLVVSTFAATLVPPPDDGSEETSTATTTARQQAASGSESEHVFQTISADAKHPARVRVTAGDELTLRVTSKRFREIEIPALGEYDEVDQYAPVTFDLLVDGAGTYPVRVVGDGRVLGRIVVSECCRTSRRSAGTSRSR